MTAEELRRKAEAHRKKADRYQRMADERMYEETRIGFKLRR